MITSVPTKFETHDNGCVDVVRGKGAGVVYDGRLERRPEKLRTLRRSSHSRGILKGLKLLPSNNACKTDYHWECTHSVECGLVRACVDRR